MAPSKRGRVHCVPALGLRSLLTACGLNLRDLRFLGGGLSELEISEQSGTD